jgi:PAS domain S-box-containing protein
MKDKKQRGEAGIEVLLEYANCIISTLREPFIVLDKRLIIIFANNAFYTTFKVTDKGTIGQPLPSLGNGQWNIPKLLQLLQEIVPKNKVVTDFEVEHTFSHIGPRVMRLSASQLRVPQQIAAAIAKGVIGEGGGEEEELILLAIEDITERKRLQKELKDSEERFRRAFETSRDGLLLVHKTEADILNANAAIQGLLGYSQPEFLKLKLWDIGVTKDDKDFQETLVRLERDGAVIYEDVEVVTKKGQNIHADVFLVDRAKVMQCNIRDITERKKIQGELEEKMKNLERFSDFAVDRELKMEELEKKEKELEEMLKSK